MRRLPPIARHAVTGILLALAVAAGPPPGTRAEPTPKARTWVATIGGHFVSDSSAEVELVLSGDVGQYAGMCGAVGGWDSLTGILFRDGRGPVAPEEDVTYRGLLARNTHVDACGTKPAPTEDQVDMCFATLVGSAKMNVELEVNEGDRGAWVKMTADGKYPVTKKITGCPEPGEWLKGYYPDGASGVGIATVPSGLLRGDTTYIEENVSLHVKR